MVLAQHVLGVGFDAVDILAEFSGVLVQEVIGQKQDVVAAGAQGGSSMAKTLRRK